MKKILAVSIAFGLVLTPVFPQAVEEAASFKVGLSETNRATVDALISKAQNSDLAYDILESLTTEIGPRLAGSDAEAKS